MLSKLFGNADIGRTLISILVVIGFFGVLSILVFHPITIDSVMGDILKIMTGTLGAKFGDVVQYHFGSSAGSKAKDAILGSIAGGDGGSNKTAP